MGLGSGKKEQYMSRWLFQCFEEGIEGLRGEHMDFIDGIYLERALGRSVAHCLAQFSNVVDSTVGSPVDFEHIHRIALGDFSAIGTLVARAQKRFSLTIEGFGQDTGNGCLADSPRTRKKIRMSDASRTYRVLQSLGYVRLTDDVIKRLGTPFPG